MAGGKLKFKGEKKVKKRRHQSVDADQDQAEGSSKHYKVDEDGWIPVPSPLHAHGPLYILHQASDSLPLTCIAINPTFNNRIIPHPIPEGDAEAAGEPTDVNHVFVCTKLPDSDTKFTLRSANGRFLAIDRVGAVIAPNEARGPQEEFEFEPHPTVKGQFAIKSVFYQKYLSIDLVAGGKLEYRGDVTSLTDDEAFDVRMQAKYVNEYEKRKELEKKTKTDDGLVIIADVKAAEDEQIRKFHTRGAGRLVTAVGGTSTLKKARKEGSLSETLLDRRMKLKSDRYC